MEVIYFPTENDCNLALEQLNNNFRFLVTQLGYELDEDGNIIGKSPLGANRPNSQVTTTWDEPHFDPLSNRWWFANPETRMPAEYISEIMTGVGGTKGTYEPPADDP